MEKWRNIPFSKEEEEGVEAEPDEVNGDDSFQRSLAGKLWTDSSFNIRAFKSTMVAAWKLRNPVEIQELSKNLFVFKFSTKRDLESVWKNGPWSFDRALLVLSRITGEEQPADLSMHYGVFWTRVYELPLVLRSEAMARKLGNIMGNFEEMDTKEAYRNGRFLRIKVSLDLRKPLKRGTVVKFKEKNLRAHFKYERLPTFCYICGRIGHQLKDCESLEELNEEGFEDLDEQDLSFGNWLRASPLPKMVEEQKSKESSSGTCSKNLFNAPSSQSRCGTKEKEKGREEAEVVQSRLKETGAGEGDPPHSKRKETLVDVEGVAESLEAVLLTAVDDNPMTKTDSAGTKPRKWIRKKNVKRAGNSSQSNKALEVGKRQLVEVQIMEGSVEDMGIGDRKRRQVGDKEKTQETRPEVVLVDQHRLPQ
ncbi:uncharacterized protein LOC131657939 [Vicia villosa]|uniref:uncharacterized protein LOC131657939 n=1 Tax=Vicia villosa TaxID=3911 RepID=UPI00273BD230|nr:uncharacterized protein LOC131657939 [Vicia villosa]